MSSSPAVREASRRMRAVQTPIIPAVGELIRANPGTISLGQGVVYYGPPAAATHRMQEFFASEENNKYGTVQGIPPLVDQVRAKLAAENAIEIASAERIVVTAGANMGFLNALFAITDPGDEVILQAPYFFNHEMAIRMLSCTPVVVPTDSHYQPVPEAVRDALSERTRAVVTVSPNNPSGAVYPERCLREINALCRDAGIYHISDEAYENFVFGETPHFSPGACEGAEAYTVSLYSLSKAYGFASWRIGYMVVPEHLFGAVLKAQDTNLICPSMPAQYAAMGCLQAGSGYCREKLEALRQTRGMMLRELATLGGLCEIPAADGAFYILLRLNTEMPPMDLVRRLIAEHRVAVIPGTTFGMDGGCYLRVAYGALPPASAAEGIRRLLTGLRTILG